MKQHAFLRSASRAVPGMLLTGWAPAHPAARAIPLVVRDLTKGPASRALREGMELGLEDVMRGAGLLRLPLVVDRLPGRAPSAVGARHPAVHVIVTGQDDRPAGDDDGPEVGPRIYTCPLRAWRPGAWSVASRRPHRTADDPGLDWHPALASPGAKDLCARFARRAGASMDEAAWRGWMAVKVAFEVALRADAGEDDLLIQTFDGHKGEPLRFSEDGHLVQPTVRVSGGFVELVPPQDSDPFADSE